MALHIYTTCIMLVNFEVIYALKFFQERKGYRNKLILTTVTFCVSIRKACWKRKQKVKYDSNSDDKTLRPAFHYNYKYYEPNFRFAKVVHFHKGEAFRNESLCQYSFLLKFC